MSTKSKSGQSIIEIIISVSILVIIASTSVIAILGSFSTSRLAKEETQAALFAKQGLEAVQSIRNQSWDNLTNNIHGLASSGGVWNFSGSSDDTNGEGKFTREITIEEVQRDESNNIVESGGTIDPDTKKITTDISWSFTPTRKNTVTMISYLTNWQTTKYIYPGSSSACSVFCIDLDYSDGTCRGGVPECNTNGEQNEPAGNRYCSNEAQGATCCCAP